MPQTKRSRRSANKSPLLTSTLSARGPHAADKHRLYEWAVQCPEAEIDFVDGTFRKLRGRPALILREDFCGTALTACEWVKRRPTNLAVGVDLSAPTLRWGEKNNLSLLTDEARARVTLLKRDVRDSGKEGTGADAVLAMNFSYWVFKTRDALRGYFASVCSTLANEGVFFLDHYGGYEAMKVQREPRHIRNRGGYTYVWDQASYNPINGDKVCHIHFEFRDGSKMNKAFTYSWRLWTLPEVQELLVEAGFKNATVYWEGDDNKGHGNGVFRPRRVGDACASFIDYIVAEK